MFPNFQGSLLTIDDSRIDRNNPSCLSNRTGIIEIINFILNNFNFMKIIKQHGYMVIQ